MQQSEWIYDWNVATPPQIRPGTLVLMNDETLRDGLQNPSVVDPSIEDKIEILHLMESLGIESVNIGLPGAGPRAMADTEALAREIATNRMRIKPNCAARTHENDIRPIAEISQRVGLAIEARFGGSWKTGQWITSSAPRKRPSNSPCSRVSRRCTSRRTRFEPIRKRSSVCTRRRFETARGLWFFAIPWATPRPTGLSSW
jgi:hypothetical protein